jgi:hypothetical protein
MKKVILLLVIMIGLVATNNTPAQRYSINKLHYDSHLYFPKLWNAYNPAFSGVA